MILIGIGLVCWRQKNRKYGGMSNAPHGDGDTTIMMSAASTESMVWETNVIALDEEAILPQGDGFRV